MYYLALLTANTIKFLESTKNKWNEDKNNENVPQLETTEVALIHFYIVNNDHQHELRVLYISISNEPFYQLLDISPGKILFLKTFILVFSFI